MKKLNIKSTSSFFSHKSPWGSYSSFILGKLGEGGGFSLNSVHPQKDNIYIGYKQGKDKPRMMPFFSNKNVGIGKEIYFGINVARSKLWYLENTTIFSEKEISRNIRWATETWLAGNLTLRFITPFGKVPYPLEGNSSDIKFWIAPLIFVQIELDNSKYSEEMTGIFALQGMRRPLSDTSNGLLQGAANGNKYGFAVKSQDGVQEILDWDIVKTAFSGGGQIRRLAFEGGLMFLVPKGEKKSFTLALATFQEGFITSNIKAQFYYTCFFKELEDVLNFGLSHFNEYLKVAQARDKELEESGLNQYRQFIIAHATRSYLANTELLIDQKGNPIFIVNEGEYQMMNTLDLTVDQAFWEIYFTPWTLKNVLDFYKDNYSYTDYVKVENTDKASGGIGFCHDQGVANMFSPKGYSSYELSGLSGCFSYMTSEETVNYILTAGIYGLLAKDTSWLKKNDSIYKDIFNSLNNRDGNEDGILDRNTSRCGDGSEITTYDNIDISLSQAQNNLYMAVKTWAGYIFLGKIFSIIEETELSTLSEEKAYTCAASIISRYDNSKGFIPPFFNENHNTSRIIPAIEGLIYPYIIGDLDAVSPTGRFGSFITVLKKHVENILKPGVCIDSLSGGWKLSSSSKNTWMSKIILSQYVAQKILKIKSEEWDNWDAIHASWLQNGCSSFAATDQINSETGKDLGSRLYPRLVTSILWINF